MIKNGKLCSPVSAEALAINADSGFVHFGPRLQIVDDAREHALGGFAGFDGRLAGAGRVHADEADSIRQDGAEIFGKIFLAAVEAADRQNDRDGAVGVLRQAKIADNLRAFERNVNDFERRVHETSVREKRFERLDRKSTRLNSSHLRISY